MIHSFLIVGGTREKRQIEARRVAAEETIVKPNLDKPQESEKDVFGGTLSDGGEMPSVKEFTPSRVNEAATRRLTNFDTTILEPEEDKQAISIDQVRDLQHQLSLKPYAAKFKTGIILEAQRMTVEAQNALLKTLEEPPAHSILILTAPSTKRLLPTIVSRCQIVRLQAEIDLDFESAEHQQVVEEFLGLLQQGGGERLAWIEENKSTINNLPAGKAGQQSTINLLDVWISILRDLLLINSGCQDLTLNHSTIQPFSHLPISRLSNSSILCSDRESTQILTEALEQAIKTKNLLAKTNVSPRLALEVLLLDLPILQPSQP